MAGQAIEDGLFLTWLLSHPAVKKNNIVDALAVYDAIRRPRANRVLESSEEVGSLLDSAGRTMDVEAFKVEMEQKHFHWIWEHDHRKDFVAAEEEMQQRGLLP
jgi:salicylate hydroxylase